MSLSPIPCVIVLCTAMVAVANAGELRLSDWSGFAESDRVLRNGHPALYWANIRKATTVPAKKAPRDLSSFRTLSFRIHSATPKNSILTLIFFSENPETEGKDYYYTQVKTDWKGWRLIQIPLEGLRVSRTPLGWDRIDRIFWSSNWAQKLEDGTEVHLCDFTLSTEPIRGCDAVPGEGFSNRSFEVDSRGKRQPDGWGCTAFQTSSKVAIDDEISHGGNRSLRIANGTDADARGGLFKGFKPDQTEPGATCVLSAWVKVEGTSGNAMGTYARITTVDRQKRVIKRDYRKCGAGPFDWKPFKWKVALPENTYSYNIVLVHHGEGTAWWDDVSWKNTSE